QRGGRPPRAAPGARARPAGGAARLVLGARRSVRAAGEAAAEAEAEAPEAQEGREALAMALVVWVMMGIAVWHFTVFVPDRFWGGIVGAFLAAFISAALFGFIVNGGTIPGRDDTHLIHAVIAIRGAAIGLALSSLWGARMDREHGIDHGHTREGAH